MSAFRDDKLPPERKVIVPTKIKWNCPTCGATVWNHRHHCHNCGRSLESFQPLVAKGFGQWLTPQT